MYTVLLLTVQDVYLYSTIMYLVSWPWADLTLLKATICFSLEGKEKLYDEH